MKWKKWFIFLILFSITLCCMTVESSDTVTIENTIHLNVDNENYTIPIALSSLTWNETNSWIRLDNLDVNITSKNAINITVSYLNSDIINQVAGTTVLTFNADTTAGTVWFNLSGFKVNHSYGVYRDDVLLQSLTSNSDGNISFSNTVWSDHEFDFVDQGNTVRVTYAMSATADTTDTSYTVINLVGIVGLAVVAAVILFYVIGMGKNKGGM